MHLSNYKSWFSLHYLLIIIRAHLQVCFRKWATCGMPAWNVMVGSISLNQKTKMDYTPVDKPSCNINVCPSFTNLNCN